GCRAVDGELEPRRVHCASPACHRETTQSCEGQRFHSVTNRVHLTCTPGSVGDLGGRPPRSTRPQRSQIWWLSPFTSRRAGRVATEPYPPPRPSSIIGPPNAAGNDTAGIGLDVASQPACG